MGLFNSLAIMIVLTAGFGYINQRFLKLPTTIGIMLMALVVSMVIVFVGQFSPELFTEASHAVSKLNFSKFLMEVMLSFLLFAGAFHLDTNALLKQKLPVLLFATLGVIISTFIVGTLMYYLLIMLGINVPFINCLLFGSLISPTDPIAVLAILKKANVPHSIETNIAGESLLNDGVAVVVFLSIYELADAGVASFGVTDIAILFVQEAVGGAILGLLLGYVGRYLLISIDEYIIEVIITLAIVVGGYAFASAIHVSGPLAVVVTGLFISLPHEGMMSDITAKYVSMFWEMVDEILNALLFLLIGFEVLAIVFEQTYLIAGILAIIIVLLARVISVAIPYPFTKIKGTSAKSMITILTWGGLRGGISVALALSLKEEMYRDLFVSVTYVVVIFSIVVQGLTVGNLVKKLKL